MLRDLATKFYLVSSKTLLHTNMKICVDTRLSVVKHLVPCWFLRLWNMDLMVITIHIMIQRRIEGRTNLAAITQTLKLWKNMVNVEYAGKLWYWGDVLGQFSIGVKSWLANKGITIQGFLPIMLQHYWYESFDGDSFISQSRFDADAGQFDQGFIYFAYLSRVSFLINASLL